MQPLLGGGESEVAFMVFGTKSGVSSERTGYLTYDGSTILASLLQYKFVSYGWFHTLQLQVCRALLFVMIIIIFMLTIAYIIYRLVECSIDFLLSFVDIMYKLKKTKF